MSTMTLTEFLLARIAEDETEARDAGADAMSGSRWKHYPQDAYEEVQALVLAHSRRVLAECEAKQRIVQDVHFDGRSGDHLAPWCSTCSDDEHLVSLPCPTLRLLALPYADHPDYREGWKP